MPHRETNDVDVLDEEAHPSDRAMCLSWQLIDFLQTINDELDRPVVRQSDIVH
ncbi:MAG TPA: hypothetical protein VFG20_02355 [Planctomycetaceae bacterium]|nr:hypothetical protein [Planctomycetaceae bacterium]